MTHGRTMAAYMTSISFFPFSSRPAQVVEQNGWQIQTDMPTTPFFSSLQVVEQNGRQYQTGEQARVTLQPAHPQFVPHFG